MANCGWLPGLFAKILGCCWLLLMLTRISDAGKDAEPENKKKVVDTGPDLSVLRKIQEQMSRDYGDTEEPRKAEPVQRHFVFNVSFYADAADFDDDPDNLEKDLNEMIPVLDEWMNKLTEEGFSVKLNYKLKKVFAPSDPDRIHYNFRGQSLSGESVLAAMAKNKLINEDKTAHIHFLMIPRHPNQFFYASSHSVGIGGMAQNMAVGDLGLGVAQIFTKKSLIDDELKKTGSGYKFKDGEKLKCYKPGWECHSKYGKDGKQARKPGVLYYTDFKQAVFDEAAKQGILENPTMELMDEVYSFNKTFKMTNMAVVAHEIGHLLGAPEMSVVENFFDDESMELDAMKLGGSGPSYGASTRYSIYLYLACGIKLDETHFQNQRMNIKSRSCNPDKKLGLTLHRPRWLYPNDTKSNSGVIKGGNNKGMDNDGMGSDGMGSDGMGSSMDNDGMGSSMDNDGMGSGMGNSAMGNSMGSSSMDSGMEGMDVREETYTDNNGMKITKRIYSSKGSGGGSSQGRGNSRRVMVPVSSMDSHNGDDSGSDNGHGMVSHDDAGSQSDYSDSNSTQTETTENKSATTTAPPSSPKKKKKPALFLIAAEDTESDSTETTTKKAKQTSKKKAKKKTPKATTIKPTTTAAKTTASVAKTTASAAKPTAAKITAAQTTAAADSSSRGYLVQLEKGRNVLLETKGNASLSK